MPLRSQPAKNTPKAGSGAASSSKSTKSLAALVARKVAPDWFCVVLPGPCVPQAADWKFQKATTVASLVASTSQWLAEST